LTQWENKRVDEWLAVIWPIA